MAQHLPVPACCATLGTLALAHRVIAAYQVGLLKALFKQPTGSLLLRHTGIQFAAIHIAVLDTAWAEQQALRKLKRARTKEEEQALGWRSKREIQIEVLEQVVNQA
jgi:hypothetical protein